MSLTSGVRPRTASRPPLVLLVPALAAGALTVLPPVYLAVRAGEAGAARVLEVLWRDRTVELLVRSLGLAATVAALCLVLGVGLAWTTARVALPWPRLWPVLAVLPLAVPSYVAAYAWISVVPSVAGFGGSVLVLTACSYPFVYLPVLAALRRADASAEEAARCLGHGPWSTFRLVTLPGLRPSAAAGTLLVVLYVLSDFGAVAILRYDVFTRVIHASYRSSFDRTPAAVLGLLLVVVTAVVALGEARARGRASTAPVGGQARRSPRAVPAGRLLPAVLAGHLAVAALALGVPLATVAYWGLRGASVGVDVAVLVRAAWTTVAVSALAAVVTLVLAAPVGVLAARYRSRFADGVERLAYAGHALPGIVIGLSVVFVGIRLVEPLYQRLPMLLAGYAVVLLPLAVGAVRAAVDRSPPGPEEVARSLGRSPAGVLRAVTLPVAAPGVLAGGLLALLTCMKELPATLLLRPTGTETLATRLWTETGAGAYAAAAPYALVLVAVAALPAALLGGAVRQAGGRT